MSQEFQDTYGDVIRQDPLAFVKAFDADAQPFEEHLMFLNPAYVPRLLTRDFTKVDLSDVEWFRQKAHHIQTLYPVPSDDPRMRMNAVPHLNDAGDPTLPIYRRVLHFEVAASRLWNLMMFGGGYHKIGTHVAEYMARYTRAGGW